MLMSQLSEIAKVLQALLANGATSTSTAMLKLDLELSDASVRRHVSSAVLERMLLPLQRGRFLLVPERAWGRSWTPSDGVLLKSLIVDAGGAYQFCGPNAFQHFGWDDQVPNRVYAYNTRISGSKSIAGLELNLILVRSNRIGSVVPVRNHDASSPIWPTRSRALLDAVYDWSRFDSLPRGFLWIQHELRESRITAADLVDVFQTFGNQNSLRRLGWVLQELKVPVGLLRKLKRSIRESSTLIPLDPTKQKRGVRSSGKTNKEWGVVINVEF